MTYSRYLKVMRLVPCVVPQTEQRYRIYPEKTLSLLLLAESSWRPWSLIKELWWTNNFHPLKIHVSQAPFKRLSYAVEFWSWSFYLLITFSHHNFSRWLEGSTTPISMWVTIDERRDQNRSEIEAKTNKQKAKNGVARISQQKNSIYDENEPGRVSASLRWSNGKNLWIMKRSSRLMGHGRRNTFFPRTRWFHANASAIFYDVFKRDIQLVWSNIFFPHKAMYVVQSEAAHIISHFQNEKVFHSSRCLRHRFGYDNFTGRYYVLFISQISAQRWDVNVYGKKLQA